MSRMRRKWQRPIAALALLVAIGALLWPAGRTYSDAPPLDYAANEIELGGKLGDINYEDLDGDGLQDLLVVRDRQIEVYFQQATGFLGKAQQSWTFSKDAVIFDTIDLEGDGRREIAYLSKDGVFAYALGADRKFKLAPSLLCKADPLTRRPSAGEIRRKDLCRDLDGDGKEDLLIPEAAGFGLYLNEGGRFGRRQPLFAPPSAAVVPGTDRLSSKLTAVYWYSNPRAIDFNHDKRVDLVVAVDDRLRVFPQSDKRSFPQVPKYDIPIPDQKLLAAGERPGFDLDLTMPLKLEDLNRDGYVDLLSTHIGQGTTRIFLGGPQGAKDLEKPKQTIRAKGVTFLSFTIDADGDGLLDLVVPRMEKIGFWSIVKILVSRSVPVEMLLYYQRKDGKEPYPREPDVIREIEIPVLFKSTGDKMQVGTSFVATLEGDFNKDGRCDVLYRTELDEMSVFYSNADRTYPDDASASLKIKDVSDYRFLMADVPDLNGDGISDIVLRYYSWDRKGDRISVFLSKGRK